MVIIIIITTIISILIIIMFILILINIAPLLSNTFLLNKSETWSLGRNPSRVRLPFYDLSSVLVSGQHTVL